MMIGDVRVASVIVFPIIESTIVTPGFTNAAMALATEATARAPTMTSSPSGSFFSMAGPIRPTT